MSDVGAETNPSSREEIATGFPLVLLFRLEPVSLIRGPVCPPPGLASAPWKTEEGSFPPSCSCEKVAFFFHL